jgi:glyoxylase-like metal-dependent hydrolase (beta-lactamase superfamily II)
MVGPTPASWSIDAETARAFELLPGFWQLRLPLPWEGISAVNAFVCGHPGGGAILFDCGSAGHESHWEALASALGQAGYAVADVRQVVLTHYHSDHVGLLERLIAESGCEVLGHPAIEAFTDGRLDPDGISARRARRALLEGAPPEICAAAGHMGEELLAIMSPIPPNVLIGDGDVIPSVLGPWNVIFTPGHAPSHLCFHQPDLGILNLADLLAAQFYPYFDYGYTFDSVGEYFLSLERVENLDPVSLAVLGHGRPLSDFPATVRAWRLEFRRRIDAVAAEIAAGATNAWEITTRLYDIEAQGDMASLDLGEVIAYLRHLRLSGRVLRRTLTDGSFRYHLPA